MQPYDRHYGHLIEQEFKPQLSAIVDALEDRVIPTFEGIQDDANRTAQNALEKFSSSSSSIYEDAADAYEDAYQEGVSYYILTIGIRQGIVNLFTVALHHAFEQQLVRFVYRRVLQDHEHVAERPNLEKCRAQFRQIGIDVEHFQSWSRVDELRLVSNAVKHAKGKSSKELLRRRSDLFQDPVLRNVRFSSWDKLGSQPLVGEGLYVSLDDIRDYLKALHGFWDELSHKLSRACGWS